MNLHPHGCWSGLLTAEHRQELCTLLFFNLFLFLVINNILISLFKCTFQFFFKCIHWATINFRTFNYPKKTLHTHLQSLPISPQPSQPQGTINLLCCLCRCIYPGHFMKVKSCMIRVLLRLASFPFSMLSRFIHDAAYVTALFFY